MCSLHPALNPALASKILSRLEIEAKDDRAYRQPRQSNYNAMTERAKVRLRKATAQLSKGAIGLGDWKDLCLIILREAHEEAAALGRRKSGDPLRASWIDGYLAREAMQEDERYLYRFFEQLRAKDERYYQPDGSWRKDRINQRLGNYVQKTRGTANRAFVEVAKPDDLFDWVMLNAEHCSVCPERQEGSPYTKLTLPSHPGDGRTPCTVNCGCVLVKYRLDDSIKPVIGYARTFDPPPSLDDIKPEDRPDLDAPLTAEEEENFFAI
jgi:hypothetical protein